MPADKTKKSTSKKKVDEGKTTSTNTSLYGTPKKKGFISYKDDPDYFDSHAVYHDNLQYSDLIRKKIEAGTHEFNPETGVLRKISDKDKAKAYVESSMKEAFKSPLMSAPGMIGLAGLPIGFGSAYGLSSALGNTAEGNYKTAALEAGLSALPFLPKSISKIKSVPKNSTVSKTNANKPNPAFTEFKNLDYNKRLEFINTVDETIKQKGDKIIKDLQSAEGKKRLINQFKEADPNLSTEELENLYTTRLKNVERTIKGNRAKWVKDMKNLKASPEEAEKYIMSLDMNEYFPFKNAHYGHEALYKYKDPDVGLSTNTTDKVTPNTSKFNIQKTNRFLEPNSTPGYITLGKGHETSGPTVSHEVGHAIQRGDRMPIDDELRKLIDSFALSRGNPVKGFVDDIWRYAFSGSKNINRLDNELDYFLSGSKGKEPYPFAREARDVMMENKTLNDTYDLITPENITKTKKQFSGIKDDNRLFYFIPPWDRAKLAATMNKAPGLVPYLGAGYLGYEGLAESENPDSEQKAHGGYLDTNKGKEFSEDRTTRGYYYYLGESDKSKLLDSLALAKSRLTPYAEGGWLETYATGGPTKNVSPKVINDYQKYLKAKKAYDDSAQAYNTGKKVYQDIGKSLDERYGLEDSYEKYFTQNYDAGKLKYPVEGTRGKMYASKTNRPYTKKDLQREIDLYKAFEAISSDPAEKKMYNEHVSNMSNLLNLKVRPTATAMSTEVPSIMFFKKPVQPVEFREGEEQPVQKQVSSSTSIEPTNKGLRVTKDTRNTYYWSDGVPLTKDEYNRRLTANKATGGWLEEYAKGGDTKSNTLEGDLISKVIMNRNKNKDFVQRANALGMYPESNMFSGFDPEAFGNKMSHKMVWGEDESGQAYMYPSVYNPNNEDIKVPNQYADYISSEGYKKASGMEYAKGGELIKRADGSYSKRGLWDNIRANKGSGKKPTKEMLEQEAKIKAEYARGGEINLTTPDGEKHIIYKKESPTGNGKGKKGNIMVTHPTKDKGKWDTIDLTDITDGEVKTIAEGKKSTLKWHKENPETKAKGGWLNNYK